tara:strand:- start:21 stop:395 length:375 start_codon:yes stop_codon:yes gene_type:complete
MDALHEKRKKRAEAWSKLTDKQKKEHDKDFYQCTHAKFRALSYVDRKEALEIFTNSKFKAEYTHLLKDGTNRWLWTVRDKDYNKVGFILGTPTIDQKQGNYNHNDPFKSDFDYMEIDNHNSIAG